MDKGKATGSKLTRQRSRLQMHAPSSIQVVPVPANVAEWNVAIPLLSPLDIVSLPAHWDLTAAEEAEAPKDTRQPSDGQKDDEPITWSAWQHPAAPFYYEPAADNGPALLLTPNCA